MPLKSILDSLDGVPEALQGAYKQRQDGKYIIDLEGFDDVPNALTALGRERKRANELEAEMTRIRDRFKDIDPVKAREAQKVLDELEADKILNGGKLDKDGLQKYVDARVKTFREEADGKINGLTETNKKLDARLRKLSITDPLKTALGKSKARPDMIELMAEKLASDWAVDDEYNPFPLGDDKKTPRYGKDANTPMTADEFVEVVARKAYPSAFEGSSGSGANPNGSSTAGRFTLSRADARDTTKYRAASEAAAKAGQQLTITD
jgi:hypothetical protein